VRRISPRQMDRHLAAYRREIRKRRYGRTKPGTLLKHHIPLKTDRWDVAIPGFTEGDLVAHCGRLGNGEFVLAKSHARPHHLAGAAAVLGKSQVAVQTALEELRQALPFGLRGIDSDNGSEFINQPLYDCCQAQEVQFTRGRPSKKDNNAHIEQKNWTHVRKLLGYVRYDSRVAQAAIHALYRHELRLFQNLFLPSVKLIAKEHVGARLRRYDAPRTPLERVLACPEIAPEVAAGLQRARLDPYALANPHHRPPLSSDPPAAVALRPRLSLKPAARPSSLVTSKAAR